MRKVVVTGLVLNIGKLPCGLPIHGILNGDIETNERREQVYISSRFDAEKGDYEDVSVRLSDMPVAIREFIAQNKRDVILPERGIMQR